MYIETVHVDVQLFVTTQSTLSALHVSSIVILHRLSMCLSMMPSMNTLHVVRQIYLVQT